VNKQNGLSLFIFLSLLCSQGTVTKLSMPSVLPGLPQPCTPTSFKKINDISPALKDNFKGQYVWNREVHLKWYISTQ